MIFKKAKKSLGLEITSTLARVVEIVDSEGVKEVRTSNEISLPEGVVMAGVVKDKKQLAVILKSLWQKASPFPIKNKQIHFAIPDELVYISLISSRLEEHKGIKQILEEEYQKNIPIKIADSEFSYKVIDKQRRESVNDIEVVLVASLKKSLLQWQNFFEENGYKIEYFDIDILSNYRAIVENNDSVVATLTVKDLYSRFAIFSNHGLEFEYSLHFGRTNINASLRAQELRGGDIAEDVSMQGFIEDIKENISYFESHGYSLDKNLKVSKILLSGQKQEMDYLHDYIKKHGHGLVAEKSQNIIDPNFNDTRFNQVIGLAMRSWSYKYEKKDPFLPCIGHSYSLETNIKNNEENIIQFLYGIKNTVIIPFAVIALIVAGWLFLGLINGSEKAEHPKVPDTETAEDPVPTPVEAVVIEEKVKQKFIKVNDIGILLNVRKGPGTSFEIIGQVEPVSEQVLVEEKDGWYNIEWPNEDNAWISADYAKIEE